MMAESLTMPHRRHTVPQSNLNMNCDMENRVIRLLAVAAVIVFCLHSFSDNKADVDLWGNLGFVKVPAWSSGFHYENTFSFTEPDHPWVNHEWGAEYILRMTYDRLGDSGLLALKIILGLGVVLLMYVSIRSECPSTAVRFFYMLLTISTMSYGFSTRPHHFTYLLYAVFLLLLKKWPRNRFLFLFIAPFMGMVWANLHGAFFIGALLIGVYIILETTRTSHVNDTTPRHITELGAALGMFIAASLINPYGSRLWGFILESAGMPRPYLSEWAPFNRAEYLAIHPDFVVLAVISFAAIFFSRKPKDITWTGILATSFVAAIILRRNIPLFAITAAFIVPQHIDDIAAKPLEKLGAAIPKRLLIGALCIFMTMSGWYALYFGKSNPFEIEVPQDRFPTGIVSFMKENKLTGNALVFFDWAEYSIWHLYPDCRQFLDGRFSDAYSKQTIEDYFNFLYCGPNWENALKNYPTDIVLIHKGNPAYKKMIFRDDWLLVCDDSIAALFLKKSAHADFMEKLSSGKLRVPHPAGSTYSRE
jgi:hypothetical protein